MANPHYQHVLEQDQHLPAPLRWLTRAMSSWWTISVLAVGVVGYAAAAHVPLAGRYLWQSRWIDTTQQQVLTWWPLQAGAVLLAVVIAWAALRRIPLRLVNMGRLICLLGLAIILVSQSWAFRYQQTGVAAVPLAQAPASARVDPLSLNYTTRYGDTTRRELVVMIAGTQPVPVSLDGLPRWNDAAGEQMPTLRVHDHPRLAAMLDFKARITTAAYLADGQLNEQPDGTQSATPTPIDERDTTTLPYPDKALLAVTFEVEPDEGKAATTTVWVPFEPGATDSLLPQRFYNVQGLGSVGLSFRPASRKLPFAVAGSTPDTPQKASELTLYLADSDPQGKLLQPGTVLFTSPDMSPKRYQSIDEDGNIKTQHLAWLNPQRQADLALIGVADQPAQIFITTGLITFVLGVILDFLLGYVGPKTKRNPTTPTDKQQAAQ